jgi:tetratricopeptide (TPR) repeat protein
MRKKTLISATAVALLAMSFPIQSEWLEVIGCRQAMAEEEDPEITAEAKKHYKLGQDAFTEGKYDLAIKELKRAYVLKRIPAILVNIAMTYRKTKDYEMSIYFYKKFLAEVPADDKQRPSIETAIAEVEKERTAASQPAQLAPAKPAVELAKPAVEAAKPVTDAAKSAEPAKAAVEPAKAVADAAKPAGTDTAAPTGEAAKTDTPAPAQPAAPEKAANEWAHTPVDAAPPGQPVDIRVQMPVMKGVKVKVFFRKEGQANFESLELKRRGNEKVARIPETVAQGKAFQYYIEAKDQAGTVIKAIGNEFSPNLVLMDPTVRPQMIGAELQADAADDEELAKRTKAGPSRDIENEQATFDLGSQERAMAKLRQQMRDKDRAKSKTGKALLGPMGWTGAVAAVLGLGGLAGGGAFLGLASSNASLVSGDSACEVKVKVNGVPQCPHFGPNEDPTLSRTLKPATSEYERKGLMYDKVGISLTAVGGALLAGGGALLTYDLIKRYSKEKPAAPKTRKVKKVIEVEEPATSFLIAPVLSPDTVGVVSLFNY